MKNKNLIIAISLTILCLIIGFGVVILKGDLGRFYKYINYEKETLKSDNEEIEVYVNNNYNYHNTDVREEKIEYIVIHYTGNTASAPVFMSSYNNFNTTNKSVDFFVDHNGDIYKYNLETENRYAFAVGGHLEETQGGSLYEKVTNENSISIEMCVKNDGLKEANAEGWYILPETVDATIQLVKYLMDKYDIPVTNVIRHYDVNGKLCPGIVGWNKDSGSEKEWENFLEKLEE